MTTTLDSSAAPAKTPTPVPAQSSGAFSPRQLIAGIPGAFRKLDPREMWRNPVMFIVEVGAVLTTFIAITEIFTGPAASGGSVLPVTFTVGIASWL